MQERFQMADAGMRGKEQASLRRNVQYYKPILSKFEIGERVWVLDPKIIPGSRSRDALR